MKIAVIDYSMLRHISTWSVKKHQNMNAAEGHLNCIAQRMSEILFSLKTLEKFDSCVFALDSKPYWRDQEMAHFYKTNTKFLVHEEQTYWSAYGAIYANEEGKRVRVKKKDAEAILAEGIESWEDFEQDAEEFPLPKYKGNRKPLDYSWLDCDPSKFFEFAAKLPLLYAKLLNGIVVESEGAEADDIAGVACKRAADRGNDILLISGDSDWAQLAAYYPNVTFYDPYREKRITYADRAELIPKIQTKIIGGDSGDGIIGCAQKSGYGPIGETKAAQVVEAKAWDEKIEPNYLGHNKRMVRLHPDCIPFDIVAGIDAAINAKVRSQQAITWEDLNLSQSRMNELEINGKAQELWNTVKEK